MSERFEVRENYFGLYEVASTASDNIYATITDVLLDLKLSISKVRGQCYDGASAMSGCKSGVVTRLCAAEPRAVFTHCYGHALNLACGDTIKQSKLMLDALNELVSECQLPECQLPKYQLPNVNFQNANFF